MEEEEKTWEKKGGGYHGAGADKGNVGLVGKGLVGGVVILEDAKGEREALGCQS